MKIGILTTEIYDTAKNFKKHILSNYSEFIEINNPSEVNNVDTFLVLGGDGFMLRCIHKYYIFNIPFFGINYGNLGFLLNSKDILDSDLLDTIKNSQVIEINPLNNEIVDVNDKKYNNISINELTVIRNVYKTCNIDININNKCVLRNYCGDGLVVSTPIGSTAYNSSLGSPIISHKSNSIILSSISPFKPRTFRNAILQNDLMMEFVINYNSDRRVSAYADFVEYNDIKYVKTSIDNNIKIKLLFDKNFTVEDKILKEQFR